MKYLYLTLTLTLIEKEYQYIKSLTFYVLNDSLLINRDRKQLTGLQLFSIITSVGVETRILPVYRCVLQVIIQLCQVKLKKLHLNLVVQSRRLLSRENAYVI